MTDNPLPLRLREIEYPFDIYGADVEEIQRAAASQGYAITAKDAREAWQRYSESMAAGWMTLEDTPEATWRNISHCFEGENL